MLYFISSFSYGVRAAFVEKRLVALDDRDDVVFLAVSGVHDRDLVDKCADGDEATCVTLLLPLYHLLNEATFNMIMTVVY